MLVVVGDVNRKDSFQVAAVDDQDPVETLAADGADPPFDERVGARRAYGCADRPDAVGAEDLVKRRACAFFCVSVGLGVVGDAVSEVDA